MWGLGEGLFLAINIQWVKNIFKEVISMDSKLNEKENEDERKLMDNSF